MEHEVIHPDGIFQPDEPYAPARRIGNLLFIAGQVAFDAQGQMVGRGDARRQAEQTWSNIRRIVEAAGGTMDCVVRILVLLVDIRDAPAEQEVRRQFFPSGRYPSCTLMQAANLGLEGLLMEIEATAVLPA
jgi:enamine deaminase RidA (YjgF/YER057c/UK114 family)